MINKTNTITDQFWQDIKFQEIILDKTDEPKNELHKKVLNWLNEDNLDNIVIDNNVFWVELTCSTATLPKYVFNYIKRYMRKRGFNYLYDITKGV